MVWGNNSDGLPLHLPQPEGTYVPGCRDVVTEDCLMRLHYPTDLTPNTKEAPQDYAGKWVRWVAHEKYLQGMAKVVGVWTWVIRLVFALIAGDMHIPAVWESKPRQKGPAMPVILLSHGLGGCRFFYSNTCVELASRGFVVAALEHGDQSASATYRATPDVKWLDFLPLPKDTTKHAAMREAQIEKRVSECMAGIDLLESINRGQHSSDSGLSTRLDLSSLVMMGHSFGGATALKTLSQDNRLKAGIILDAWMYPINKYKQTMPSEVTQPLLFINTQTFHVEKNLTALRLYTGQHEVYTIRGTTHEHQTDSTQLLGSWLNRRMKKIDYQLAAKINNQLILRWLRETISQGDADDAFLAEQSPNIIQDLVLATETLA